MNLTDMISAIRFRLGNKTGIDADIIREIQTIQLQLEDDPRIEYHFLQFSDTIPILEGVASLAKPQDFLRMVDGIKPKILIGDSYKRLRRVYIDEAKVRYGVATGVPEAYTLSEGVITLYPIPDKAYSLEVTYLKRSPLLSNVTTPPVLVNAWTSSGYNLLLNRAGIIIAQALRDKDALQAFSAGYGIAKQELLVKMVAEEEVEMDSPRVNSKDGLSPQYLR